MTATNGAQPTANGSHQSSTNLVDGVVPIIIDGKDVIGIQQFPVNNPAGHQVWRASGASTEDVDKAIGAAERALPGWTRTKPARRRDIFLRAADLFAHRIDELAQYQADETGADPKFVDWILNLTVDNLKEVAGRCAQVVGTIPGSGDDGRDALVLKEPYGVILGISPWNAPFPLGCRAVAYALAAGNTCILKGSELSPRCYYAIVDIFRQAGLPDGCLNLIIHRPEDASEITTRLIAHPVVKKVNFTGSTAVGSIVSALAGKPLKPIITELGGKASAIVLADADLKKAAIACVTGGFLHAGQVCMATERVIVHHCIKVAFMEEFKAATIQLYGEGGSTPRFVSPTGARKTNTLFNSSLRDKATVIYGRTDEFEEADLSSTDMKPIILTDVKKGSELFENESFGPMLAIYTFDTEEEALGIANDTIYGLSGAVFTKDLAASLRVARGYETGAVHINAMTIHDESNLPHGGSKASGWGRFTAQQGLEEWLRCKVVTYEQWSKMQGDAERLVLCSEMITCMGESIASSLTRFKSAMLLVTTLALIQ